MILYHLPIQPRLVWKQRLITISYFINNIIHKPSPFTYLITSHTTKNILPPNQICDAISNRFPI